MSRITSTPKALESIFYVYVYLDPTIQKKYLALGKSFSLEPFYVGYGHGERSLKHLITVLRGKEDSSNPHKSRRIAKIIRSGQDPVIKVIRTDLTEQEAKDFETEIITCLGRRDLGTGPLTNKTNGGDGTSGHIHSDETKLFLSQSSTEQWENKTPDEIELFKINRSKHMTELWSMFSEDERKEFIARQQANNWHNLPEKEKQKVINKFIKTRMSRTDEEKRKSALLLSASLSDDWSSMSTEEYTARCNAISDGLNSRSDVDKTQSKRKRAKTVRSRTPEKRASNSKNISDAQLKVHENLTEDDRERRSIAYKKGHASRTDEQKSITSRRCSIAQKKKFKNMTVEQYETFCDKVSKAKFISWEKRRYASFCMSMTGVLPTQQSRYAGV